MTNYYNIEFEYVPNTTYKALSTTFNSYRKMLKDNDISISVYLKYVSALYELMKKKKEKKIVSVDDEDSDGEASGDEDPDSSDSENSDPDSDDE